MSYGAAFQDLGAAVQSFAGAAGDLFTAGGDAQAATLFGQAATIAEQNQVEAKSAYKLQEVQTARQVAQVQGTAQAIAGAGNLKVGGSVAAILRSNAQQGALANQLIAEQGNINVNSYMEQQLADQEEQARAAAAAQAADAAAFGQIAGSAFDVIGAVASL